MVSLTQSNAPLRVFPGVQGALFVLPDGSLWQWGRTAKGLGVGGLERVGADIDWVQAAQGGAKIVGLRRDGTLWEWGYVGAASGGLGMSWIDSPRQVGAGHDWAAVAAGPSHAAVLRRDGTLWTWGDNSLNQLGIGPGLNQSQPVQVGTNADWASVCCEPNGTLAVRKDGTLWAWGNHISFANAGAGVPVMPITLFYPSQVCRETNWAEVNLGMGGLMRTRSGELWHGLYAAPAPDASATLVCRLITSNAVPLRVATGLAGAPKLYELRKDGSLWERTQLFAYWQTEPAGKWRRIGKRTDWVSIWGANGTTYGLTADGVVWTWGFDPTRPANTSLAYRLAALQARIGNPLRASPAPLLGWLSAKLMPYQFTPEPRPLMRILPPQSSNLDSQ
jgi:trimeric autotransporter adhesin